MPITDAIYPRTRTTGTVSGSNASDFTAVREQASGRITRHSSGVPLRNSSQLTTRIVCLSGDNQYHRSEFAEWGGESLYAQRHGDGMERWFGMSFYFPSSTPTPTGGQWMILWQMHWGYAGPSPTTCIQAQGGRLDVLHRKSGGSIPTQTLFSTLPKDTWIDVLIFIRFSAGSDGRKTILAGTAASGGAFNPTRQLDYSGPTRGNDAYGFVQTGCYRSYTTSNDYTIYLGEQRWRSARSTIESQLWGGGGGPPPPPPPEDPPPVSNLQASPALAHVTLTWTNPGGTIDDIVVRRATGAYPATPTSGVGVGFGTGTSRTDTQVVDGTLYYYRVWVRRGTLYSSPVGITATPGSAPPPQPGSVTSSPPVVAGANLSGTITWAAAATPPAGATVTDVRFIIDSVEQFVEVSAPYSRAFDTTPLSDGAHLFNVEATFSNSTTAEDSFTAFTENTPVIDDPPIAPTSVTIAEDVPNAGIDWSVVLPADLNSTGLEVATFPRPIGTDLWDHQDAITLASRAEAFAASPLVSARSFSYSQLAATAAALSPTAYPHYTDTSGNWVTVAATSFVSGFLGGALWEAYRLTGDPVWLTRARASQAGVAGQQSATTHDVGFQLMSTFGNDFRLTGSTTARDVCLAGAVGLATRYDPDVGALRSLQSDPWNVIIDTMMNLELLFFSAANGGPGTHYDLAVDHANTTIANHLRGDGSVYQVAYFNDTTGALTSRGTIQGFGDETTWARGQAWAIHGFTIAYRETNDTAYRAAARSAAAYWMANVPANGVPYWDFSQTDDRDTSAAAIAAAGLLRLAALDPTNAAAYRAHAITILTSLSTTYLGSPTHSPFLDSVLEQGTSTHGSGLFNRGLIYGDYYFLQAHALLAAGHTETGSIDGLADGTYYVRAWATGPGGSAGTSAPGSVTIGGGAPSDGQNFLTRRFLAAVGSIPSSPWLVQAVNQGASGRVEVAADSALEVTTQSANGSASRAIVELEEDLSLDFAGGTDNVRVLHLDFTVPSGASEVDLYLIPAADTGAVDPVGSVANWVRVLLNMRGTTKNVTLSKKVSGVITTLATVDLGTAQHAGSDAFLQIALDQTNVRGAYLFNGVAAAMGAQVAHGLGIDLANLRALIVPFQTATTPSTFLVRYLKLMRRVPAQPTSAAVEGVKDTGQPWVSGVDPYESLARVELSGTFPTPDPGQPNLYRGRLGAQTVTAVPGNLQSGPLVFIPPAPSASPYTALLDAGNEAII